MQALQKALWGSKPRYQITEGRKEDNSVENRKKSEEKSLKKIQGKGIDAQG